MPSINISFASSFSHCRPIEYYFVRDGENLLLEQYPIAMQKAYQTVEEGDWDVYAYYNDEYNYALVGMVYEDGYGVLATTLIPNNENMGFTCEYGDTDTFRVFPNKNLASHYMDKMVEMLKSPYKPTP